MKSFLPCHPPHHTTVRDRLGRIAERLKSSRGATHEPAGETPKGGLTVFLDGAHIRCRPEYQQRHLDLVVGKIESRNMSRRFGLVANATASPGSRMREELSGFGWKPGRLLTVISDGELALPNLIRNAMGGDGQVKHILDRWHTSMRIRHVEAAVQGLVQIPGFTGIPVLFQRPAKSLRWWLWHGRARVAETYLKALMHDCTRLAESLWLSAPLPLVCRPAARHFTPISRTTWNPSSTMADGTVTGCPSRHLVPKDQSMTLPMPAVLDGRLNVANRKRAA